MRPMYVPCANAGRGTAGPRARRDLPRVVAVVNSVREQIPRHVHCDGERYGEILDVSLFAVSVRSGAVILC